MSFGWLGIFRQGSWRTFRSFILKERQDVGKRIAVINAELKRIGKVTMVYSRQLDRATADVVVTEERTGFTVSKGSSLEKLFQVYIGFGGNPLDISHFFVPDRSTVVDRDAEGNVKLGNNFPYGGVGYPQTSDYDAPHNSYGPYPGGFMPLRKYPPARIGGRRDIDSEAELFVNTIVVARKWVSTEIREKLNMIEWKIIKLCDLREQLITERDDTLVQAYGGLVPSLASSSAFNADRYVHRLRISRIVDMIDNVFYNRDEDGVIDMDSPNDEELARYSNVFSDKLPDEKNTAL